MNYKDAVIKIMEKANVLIEIASVINELGSKLEVVESKSIAYTFEKTSQTSFKMRMLKKD